MFCCHTLQHLKLSKELNRKQCHLTCQKKIHFWPHSEKLISFYRLTAQVGRETWWGFMHGKNAIVFRKWMSFKSERTSRSACLPKSLGFMEIRYSCKRNQISKKNLPKIQLSQFCYSNQCWEADCENNQQMGKMCLAKLVVSVWSQKSRGVIYVAIPGIEPWLIFVTHLLTFGGLYLWAWIFTTLLSSQIHLYQSIARILDLGNSREN